MKHLNILTVSVAAVLGLSTVAAENTRPQNLDLSKHIYKLENSDAAFSGPRWTRLNAINALMEAGKPDRFNRNAPQRAKQDQDGNYIPNIIQEKKDLAGEMMGPGGEDWFYTAVITYESEYVSEYYTEYLPVAIDVEFFDGDMNPVGTISDKLRLLPNERRVRLVDVLPMVSKNYFNSDDKYEIALTLLNNPSNRYGIVPHTYVYSLGSPVNAEGHNEPVKHIPGVVNDILDASDENGENFLMTFVDEGNDSGFPDVEQLEGEDYWQYQLHNWIRVHTLGAAGADGEQTVVFDKKIIYYQCQGNQQDDVAVLPLMLDGKPTICFPYYEKVFYKPFYSNEDDLFAEDNNNLVVEIWQQSAKGEKFACVQTTKIPVVKAGSDDVTWSYYGIGSFSFRNDVTWSNGAASFIITRSDFIASSDSERKAYLTYNADGSLRKLLFENAESIAFMSDLPGFDPQTLFITNDGLDYWFHFMNMRTLEIDLKMNYGLQAEPGDDPDYIIANIDRTLTPDGKSYNYVAEMRMPEYDDINDRTYMRVVWLSKDGKIEHFDKINMGNNINYAQLFLGQATLKPDYFHSDANREYMILIKRAAEGQPKEELLIGQAVSEEYPQGRDLLLLGPCQYGILNTITPFSSSKGNALQIIYSSKNNQKETPDLTICYYNLPLDIDGPAGIDEIEADGTIDGISFNGTTVTAPGAGIEVFNLQGMTIAEGFESLDLSGLAKGVYIIRAYGKAAKIAIK